MFCFCADICFAFFGLGVIGFYRGERLRRYGKYTVGVVQSSKIEIEKPDYGDDTLYILEVVFQVQYCQKAVNRTVECNSVHELGGTTDSDNQYKRKDPENWFFMKKDINVLTLKTYNKAVEMRRVMMFYDPKSPRSSATLALVKRSQKFDTSSLFLVLFFTFYLVLGCLMLYVAFDVVQYNINSESDLQFFFTCMVVIIPPIMLGCCIYCCCSGQGNTQDELAGVDLEEVVAANTMPYMINNTQDYNLECPSGAVDYDEFSCEITTICDDEMSDTHEF